MTASSFLMPAGACDCHLHVFEPGYALAPTATFIPPSAPVSAYQALQQTLGLSRAIVVQPTGYGYDNRCTLAAVAALGANARGVAVVPVDVSDDELQRLHAGGIRGLRFMAFPGGLLSWPQLEPLAARIHALGWHINLQLDGRELPQYVDRLLALPTPVVVDHIGKFLGPVTPADAAFAALCRLLDAGRCWVKLSAPYESSQQGAPDYADVSALCRVLARDYPERCLWGSNWPHPNRVPTPSDADMLSLLAQWAPSTAVQHQILAANPQALYGFKA